MIESTCWSTCIYRYELSMYQYILVCTMFTDIFLRMLFLCPMTVGNDTVYAWHAWGGAPTLNKCPYIWNFDTYDIVVLLRHRVSRYRVFADVVAPCLRPRRFLLRHQNTRCRSNYDVVGLNYDVNSAHRVCYDIVVQNYDIVSRKLRYRSLYRVLYRSHGSATTS